MNRIQLARDFSARVRTMRRERKLSAEALGHLMGCKRQQIENIESGRHSPTLWTALRLAEIFGASLDVMTGRRRYYGAREGKGNADL